MNSLSNILYIVMLFLIICLFVMILIATINIWLKSFKPRNPLILTGILIVLFIFTAGASLLSVGSAADDLVEGEFDTTPGSQRVIPRDSTF